MRRVLLSKELLTKNMNCFFPCALARTAVECAPHAVPRIWAASSQPDVCLPLFHAPFFARTRSQTQLQCMRCILAAGGAPAVASAEVERGRHGRG
jgi:hypothetical protein